MTTTPTRTPSKIDYTASGKALTTQGDNAPTAALKRHKEFLDARISQIGRWVTNAVKPEALVRFALMDMDGDKGARLRECTSQSIYLGLLACAVTGLEPGALKGEAYLVPYRNKGTMEATFQRGYRGVVKQALRSRAVVAVWSRVVYEGDFFDVDEGSANRIVHKPVWGNRGENIIAAYAIARLASGQDVHEVMDRADLDHVRAAGSESPAWKEWPDQMMRKAPVHRLGKYLPLGHDYYVGLALDHADTSADQRRIIDVETGGEGERVQIQGTAAAEIAAQAGGVSKDEAAEIERADREAAK